MQDKTIGIKLSQLADIVEDDKRHENTQLALKVEDGRRRIKRIVQFNQMVEKLNQARPQPQPQQEEEEEFEEIKEPIKAPIKTVQKQQPKPAVKEKTPKEQADEDALQFGLPKEEEDLFGNDFEEEV